MNTTPQGHAAPSRCLSAVGGYGSRAPLRGPGMTARGSGGFSQQPARGERACRASGARARCSGGTSPWHRRRATGATVGPRQGPDAPARSSFARPSTRDADRADQRALRSHLGRGEMHDEEDHVSDSASPPGPKTTTAGTPSPGFREDPRSQAVDNQASSFRRGTRRKLIQTNHSDFYGRGGGRAPLQPLRPGASPGRGGAARRAA